MIRGELYIPWQASSNVYNYVVTMLYIGNQCSIVHQIYSNLKNKESQNTNVLYSNVNI